MLLFGGVALVAAMAALPWHTWAVDPPLPDVDSFRYDSTGLQAPEQGLGRLAMLAAVTVAGGAGYVVAKGRTDAGLAARSDPLLVVGSVLVAVLVLVKLVSNLDFLGTGAWVSVVLAGLIAVTGLSLRRKPA